MKRPVLHATICLLVALCICATTSHPAWASDKVLILIDGSGSMKGFFKTGSLSSAHGALVQALESRGATVDTELYVTNKAGRTTFPKVDGAGLKNQELADGSLTLTRDALVQRRHSGPVWIITDNVTDSGEPQVGKDLKAFYAYLQGDSTKAVDILPMSLDFDGIVYGAKDKRLGHYKGQRGLVAYAILPKGGSLDDHRAQVTDAANALGDRVGAGHIPAKPLEAPAQAKMSIEQALPEEAEAGEAVLTLDSSGDKPVLRFPEKVEAGDAIKGVFAIGIKSDSGPVVLRGVPITVSIVKEFSKGNFAARGWDAVASPPAVDLGVSDKATDRVVAHISIPQGIRFRSKFKGLTDRARSYVGLGLNPEASGNVSGEVEVVLEPTASRKTARLDQSFLQRWSTNDRSAYFGRAWRSEQPKVFRLQELFRNAAAPVTEKVTQRQLANVVTTLQYPWWAPLVLIVPLLGFLLLAGAILWYLLRTLGFRLDTELSGTWRVEEPTAPKESAFGGYQQSSGQDIRASRLRLMTRGWELRDGRRTVARLKWSQFSGWRVVASGGHLVDGSKRKNLGSTLSPPRRFSILAKEDAVRPAPTKKSPAGGAKTADRRPSKRGQSDWGDSFGGSA